MRQLRLLLTSFLPIVPFAARPQLTGPVRAAEYRHAAGNLDGKIEGVHAYRVPKGSYGASSLIDTTVENKTAANTAPSNTDAITKLTDKANKVSVAVVSSGGGQAKVKVALNGDSLAAIDATPSKSASPTPSATPTPSASASTGTEAVTDGSEPVTELGSEELTAGGGRSTVLPLAAGGGAAVLAVGLGFLLVKRRRKRA
ncbi:hypothetical protein ACQPYV_18490 [Micromonospora saelicesensis]|uniref:hypothetical protein n=1 Tax=Micromonospora saelicesensis TaxID=285676 RepID=UPI003D9424F5